MERLDEGLWTHDAPFGLLGAQIGIRMTVLRAPDGLILHSPTPIDDALAARLDELGPVRWIVAPNLFHHLNAAAAKRRWPEAELVGPRGLEKKIDSLSTDLELGREATAPAGWGEDVQVAFIDGMPKLRELALLHRPSGTLVVTDFVFNLRDVGLWTKMVLGPLGAVGGPRQSRILRSAMQDRDAVRGSRDALLDWDFDALVMSHGDVLLRGGKDALRQASAWLDQP